MGNAPRLFLTNAKLSIKNKTDVTKALKCYIFRKNGP